MHISHNPKDNETDELSTSDEYYQQPIKIKCERCQVEVTTYMTEEYNYYNIIFIMLILIVYGFLIGLPLCAICLLLCKNKYHICPQCFNLIHKISFTPISVKGEFVEFKLDRCVIILRKVYTIAALILVIMIGIISNAFKIIYGPVVTTESISKTSIIDAYVDKLHYNNKIEWEQLIDSCGSKVIVENAARAQEIFERKFQGKHIEWKGHFIVASVNFENVNNFNPNHVVNYYIRMIPSETLYGADIVLSLNHKVYKKFRDLVFTKGDPIFFEAVLESLGNEWRPFHLHAVNLSKIPEFIAPDQKVKIFKGVSVEIEGKMVHPSSDNLVVPSNFAESNNEKQENNSEKKD